MKLPKEKRLGLLITAQNLIARSNKLAEGCNYNLHKLEVLYNIQIFVLKSSWTDTSTFLLQLTFWSFDFQNDEEGSKPESKRCKLEEKSLSHHKTSSKEYVIFHSFWLLLTVNAAHHGHMAHFVSGKITLSRCLFFHKLILRIKNINPANVNKPTKV